MSVIIRLQGLPWSASAMNIRNFFSGLSIPAGGVHIIGGDGGDAFIAFSSDDDARMAMKKNMCCLNDTPIQLFLSSKAEMQSVIDAARSGASSQAASSSQQTTPIGATDTSSTVSSVVQAGMQQGQNFPPNITSGMDMMNKPNAQHISGVENDFRSQMPQNQWQGFHGGMGAGDANQMMRQQLGMGGFPEGGDYQFPKIGDHPQKNRGYNNSMMGGGTGSSIDQRTKDVGLSSMSLGQPNIQGQIPDHINPGPNPMGLQMNQGPNPIELQMNQGPNPMGSQMNQGPNLMGLPINQGQSPIGSQMSQTPNPIEPQINQGMLPQRNLPQGPMGYNGNRNPQGANQNPEFFNQHPMGGPGPSGTNQGEKGGPLPGNMHGRLPFQQDMAMVQNQGGLSAIGSRQDAGGDRFHPGVNRPNFPDNKGSGSELRSNAPIVSMSGMERSGNQFSGDRATGLPWGGNTIQTPQMNRGQFSQHFDPAKEDFRNPNIFNSQDSRDRSLIGPGSMYGLNRRPGMPPDKMEEDSLPSTSYPPDDPSMEAEDALSTSMKNRVPPMLDDANQFSRYPGPEGLRKGMEMDRGRFMEHNRRFPSENHPGDMNKLPNTREPTGPLGFGNNRFPPNVHGALDDQYTGRRPHEGSFHPEGNRLSRDKDAFEKQGPSDPWSRQTGLVSNVEGRQQFPPTIHPGDRRDLRNTTENALSNPRESGRRGPSRWDTAKEDIQAAIPNNKPEPKTSVDSIIDKDQRKGSVERGNVDPLNKSQVIDKLDVTGMKPISMGAGAILSSPGHVEGRSSMEPKGETMENQGATFHNRGPGYEERRLGFESLGRGFEDRWPELDKRGPGFIGREPPVELGKPGFDIKAPGYGEGRLGFEGRGPGPEYNRPLTEGRDQGFGQRTPGFEGRAPGFEGRAPGFDGRRPEFEGRDAGFDARRPGFEGRGPGIEGRGPALEGRGPALEGRGPALEGRGPAFDRRGPALEGRGPAFDRRGPAFEERGVAFEGRGSRFEGRGSMFEGRRPGFEERGPGFEGRDPGFDGRGRGRGFEGRGRGFEGRRPDFSGLQAEMGFNNRRHEFERFDDMDIPSREEAGIRPQGGQEFDRRMQFEQRQGRYGLDNMDRMGAPFEGRRLRFEGQGPNFEERRILPFESMPDQDVDRRENLDFDNRELEMNRFRGGGYGRGGLGMRGRGSDTLRGRGGPIADISRGRGFSDKAIDHEFPLLPHTPFESNEVEDFDSRIPGRGGPMFDRPFRGRGDPFFRGRGLPGPFGRGRGMDSDRFEDAGSKDVDARNLESQSNVPSADQQSKDISDIPSNKNANNESNTCQIDDGMNRKRDQSNDSRDRRENDNRSYRRSYDRDRGNSRDRRNDDRRGRDRDERRYEERSRYRFVRDRSRRSRSRSRDRSKDSDRYSSRKSGSPRRRSETQSRCLCVKNMPLTVNYKEVRRFFQPFDIPHDGLKLVNDEKGNRKGVAYVQLRRQDNIQEALKKNGQKMDSNIVSVTNCSDEEFSKAIDSFVPVVKKPSSDVSEIKLPPSQGKEKVANPDKLRYILQLKNLPLTVTKQKIVEFFKGVTIDNNGQSAYIEYDSSGVATGNGFVEVKADVDYKKGLTFDGSKIGDNAVRVSPGKPEESDDLKGKQLEMLQRAALRSATASKNEGTGTNLARPGLMGPRPGAPLQPNSNPTKPLVPSQAATVTNNSKAQVQSQTQKQQPQAAPPVSSPAKTASQEDIHKVLETLCVHIQGLPLLATPQDIRQFFTESQIALRGINIAHDNRGKPLGEGFVEFRTKADFDKALKKDKTSLGRHIVAVKPISKKEMQERLGTSQKAIEPSSSKSEETKKDDNVGQALLATPISSNQNNNVQQEGIANDNLHPVPGGPQNGAQQQRIPHQSAPRGPLSLAPRGPQPLSGLGQQRMPNPQHPRPLMSSPIAGPEMHPPPAHGNKNIPPGVLNQSWFYVRCQNFPPDISIAEILHFFQGFRPIGHSIRLHYSSDGNPTGNAVVGFAYREEAERALASLNMKRCRQNVITLYPA